MNRTAIITALLSVASSVAFAAPVQENWDSMCAKCHGADGKAQSTLGKKLKIKDYTDAKSLESFTDAQLETAIVDGIKKDGKTLMKGFKDELSTDDAKALVAMIRKMSAK